jgi:hypothetical protein
MIPQEGARLTAEAGRAIVPRELTLQATVVRIWPTIAGYQVELSETDAARRVNLPCFLPNTAAAAMTAEVGTPFDPLALQDRCALVTLAPRFHPRFSLLAQTVELVPTL